MTRLRRSLNTLAKAFPAFLLGFTLFLGVGFFTGWNERERNAQDTIYSKLTLRPNDDGAAVLHLECAANQTSYAFLVESNEPIPEAGILKAQWLGNPSEKNQALRTAAMAFLGGPAGAVSYKSVIDSWKKTKTPGRWRYLLRQAVGVLGGISGYTLGYWQGSTWAIGCDSDLGRYVLANADQWRLAEKLYFHIAVIELELGGSARFFAGNTRNINPLDDDPLFLCETKLAAVSRELQKIDDPGEANFRRLVSLIDAYGSVKNSAEYRRIDDLKSIHFAVSAGHIDANSALARKKGYSPAAFAKACADLDAKLRPILG